MNIAFAHAQEVSPHHFTVDDVWKMLEAGVLTEDDRVELIEGELIAMAAKGYAHERTKTLLNMAFARAVPEDCYVAVESTLKLAADILVEPDLTVIARSVYKGQKTGFTDPVSADIRLVIEVAMSSMSYDRKVKARLYARFGIREFWVIDALAGTTWVHTGPNVDGTWLSIVESAAKAVLTTEAAPGLALRLSDFD